MSRVQVVLVLLALVGAVTLTLFLVRTASSSARVLRATNQFQAASVEAIDAIRQTPPNEPRQFRALQAWEQARASIRCLTADEQRTVAQTLRDRQFPTAEIGGAITAFIDAKDREHRALDEQLADLIRASGT